MSASNEDLSDDIMCTCTGTTRSDIKRLFEEGYNLDGISSKRGVLSGCGGCEWDVEAFLDQLAVQQNK
ncbi:MAG: (2Fe-2S)-binding protein [Methylophilaceae bacterium]